MCVVKTLLVAALIISSPTLGVLATDSGEIWNSVKAKQEYNEAIRTLYHLGSSEEFKEYVQWKHERAIEDLEEAYSKLSQKQRFLCAEPFFILNCE